MPHWDANSTELFENIQRVVNALHRAAAAREPLSLEVARQWHRDLMMGLTIPEGEQWRGAFRGEPGCHRQVRIGPYYGTPPGEVAGELQQFQEQLQQAISYLDERIPQGESCPLDFRGAVVELCGWVHAEWVRIHPFGNGNGRTARLWVDAIALRYGLPAFLPVRPRPGDAYEQASGYAMQGEWEPTAELFAQYLEDFLADQLFGEEGPPQED